MLDFPYEEDKVVLYLLYASRFIAFNCHGIVAVVCIVLHSALTQQQQQHKVA